jgi:hypothetical protein
MGASQMTILAVRESFMLGGKTKREKRKEMMSRSNTRKVYVAEAERTGEMDDEDAFVSKSPTSEMINDAADLSRVSGIAASKKPVLTISTSPRPGPGGASDREPSPRNFVADGGSRSVKGPTTPKKVTHISFGSGASPKGAEERLSASAQSPPSPSSKGRVEEKGPSFGEVGRTDSGPRQPSTSLGHSEPKGALPVAEATAGDKLGPTRRPSSTERKRSSSTSSAEVGGRQDGGVRIDGDRAAMGGYLEGGGGIASPPDFQPCAPLIAPTVIGVGESSLKSSGSEGAGSLPQPLSDGLGVRTSTAGGGGATAGGGRPNSLPASSSVAEQDQSAERDRPSSSSSVEDKRGQEGGGRLDDDEASKAGQRGEASSLRQARESQSSAPPVGSGGSRDSTAAARPSSAGTGDTGAARARGAPDKAPEGGRPEAGEGGGGRGGEPTPSVSRGEDRRGREGGDSKPDTQETEALGLGGGMFAPSSGAERRSLSAQPAPKVAPDGGGIIQPARRASVSRGAGAEEAPARRESLSRVRVEDVPGAHRVSISPVGDRRGSGSSPPGAARRGSGSQPAMKGKAVPPSPGGQRRQQPMPVKPTRSPGQRQSELDDLLDELASQSDDKPLRR